MKVYLMHRDRDLDLEPPLPANAEALIQDLELDTLLDAMARGDDYLRELARKCLLSGLTDPDAIRYRQHILADCLQQTGAGRKARRAPGLRSCWTAPGPRVIDERSSGSTWKLACTRERVGAT
jgi:hypothetical protein